MTQARLRVGRVGEQLACQMLAGAGMRILARNCRTRAGEIDAICIDAGTLVFVEVKTMRASALGGPERPELAVGPRKQLQVRRLARAWLAESPTPRYAAIRFDVVGVLVDRNDGAVSIDHIPNAF